MSFGTFIQILIFKVFHLTFLGKQKKGQGKDSDPRPASKSQQRTYKNKGNKSVWSPVKAWLFPRVDLGAKGWAPVGRELGILGMGSTGSPTPIFSFAFLSDSFLFLSALSHFSLFSCPLSCPIAKIIQLSLKHCTKQDAGACVLISLGIYE